MMMTDVLNDNLERVYCYEKKDGVAVEGSGGSVEEEIILEVGRGNLGSEEVIDNMEIAVDDEPIRQRLRLLEEGGGGSVQAAKINVLVAGGQMVYNTNSDTSTTTTIPTQSELRNNILTMIKSDESATLASKVRSMSLNDSTLSTLLGDLDTVLIPTDQPSFIEQEPLVTTATAVPQSYQTITSCSSSVNVVQKECTPAQQSTTKVSVNCCSGSLTTNDLQCKRPNCKLMDNYIDAAAHCESNGMRLCTVVEVESKECCNQGCGFNDRLTWTSDVCGDGDASSSIGVVTESPTSSPTKKPSAPPTSSPSSSPTKQPSAPPTSSPSSSPTKKPSDSPTSSPTSSPSREPSPSPTNAATTTSTSSPSPSSQDQDINSCPEGQCLDPDGGCQNKVECFIDPCDVNDCGDGEVCEANYCGGCNAICSSASASTTFFPTTPTPSPETPRPTYSFGMPTLPPMVPTSSPLPTTEVYAAPVESVDKYICNKDDPLPATICAEGSLAGGKCSSVGAADSCGKGEKVCWWASCQGDTPVNMNSAIVSLNSENDGGDFKGSNTMIIGFASSFSLIIAFAIGLVLFAARKRCRDDDDDKDELLETTFNTNIGSTDFGASDGEEDIEVYDNYEGSDGEFYPASKVDMKYTDPDKKSSRFGFGSAFGSSGNATSYGGKGGANKNSTVKSDQPLSRQDGIDDVVDDLALDFLLSTTGNSKKKPKEQKLNIVKEFRARDFRPKLDHFRSFHGEDTEENSNVALGGGEPKQEEGKLAQDFRPTLMMNDTFSDTFGFAGDIEEGSADVDRNHKVDAPREDESRGRANSSDDQQQRRPDPDGHLILSDIKNAAERSRRGRYQKSNQAQKVDDRLVNDITAHRAKMNSFLDDTPESVPEQKMTSAVAKKAFVPPSRGSRRSGRLTKGGQNDSDASPDRRFFTFDGDDDSGESEDKSHIPNLIVADDKSEMVSMVSSIGQVDWRGRERTDRRVRFDSEPMEDHVVEVEDSDSEAKIGCRTTLQKTKNILSQTLERSLQCKARVVSPTSDNNDDEDDNRVSRPWAAKWDAAKWDPFGSLGKAPQAVEDPGYQSSNYDPDSDWEPDDNDMTVDYSAEGSFMPSPLKGVGFDFSRR
jgi:hypothetical protein